jgi:hypothetical protein
MSQRNSNYERQDNDFYETPEWVTECILPYIPKRIKAITEPASGKGKMANVFKKYGYTVAEMDIKKYHEKQIIKNFLEIENEWYYSVITNPPYNKSVEFITHALDKTKPLKGFVAMLLRTDHDHAKTRSHLYDHVAFAGKVVLRKRIRWIEGSTGSPSYNHAWYMWSWTHEGPPNLFYEPKGTIKNE